MDIKYEIEPVFKIEFFKIKCIDFKNKKKKLISYLKKKGYFQKGKSEINYIFQKKQQN